MNIGNAVKIHSHLTIPENLSSSEAMNFCTRIRVHIELLNHGLGYETNHGDTIILRQEIQRLEGFIADLQKK